MWTWGGQGETDSKSGEKGGRSAKTMVHPFSEMAGTHSFWRFLPKICNCFMCFSVCRCSWLTLGIGGGSLWFGDCIYRHLTESLDLGESLGEMRPFHSEIDGSVENGSNIWSNHFLYPYKGNGWKWVNCMKEEQRTFENICVQMKSLRSGILDPIARAIQRLDWWWPEWESLSWVLACARWKWNSGKDDRTPLDFKDYQDDQFAFCQGFWSWRWSCKSTWWPVWKRW